MKLVDKIENVAFFKVDDSGVLYYKNQEGDLYQKKSGVVKLLDTAVFDDFQVFDGALIYNKESFTELELDKNKSTTDSKYYLVNADHSRSGIYFLVDKDNHGNLRWVNRKGEGTPKLLSFAFGWELITLDFPDIILHEWGPGKKIKKFSLVEDRLLWEIELNEISDKPDFKIDKMIALTEKEIYISVSDASIIRINKNTGKIEKRILFKGSEMYKARNQRLVPNTYIYAKDCNSNYLFALDSRYCNRINMENGRKTDKDLSTQFERYDLSDFRFSMNYGQDENYIYSICNLNKDRFGITPQCIFGFHKIKETIDWIYRFEEDVILTSHPVKVKNKLYQLSGLKRLYVFQE